MDIKIKTKMNPYIVRSSLTGAKKRQERTIHTQESANKASSVGRRREWSGRGNQGILGYGKVAFLVLNSECTGVPDHT